MYYVVGRDYHDTEWEYCRRTRSCIIAYIIAKIKNREYEDIEIFKVIKKKR